MAVTDPIADLLTRIRNAQSARHETVEVPFSKIKQEIVKILSQEGYISTFKVNERKPYKTLTIVLKYGPDREPAIRKLRRVSRPGCRIYKGGDEIPVVLSGLGVNILSTSKGVFTGKKAREQGLGGELLCEVY